MPSSPSYKSLYDDDVVAERHHSSSSRSSSSSSGSSSSHHHHHHRHLGANSYYQHSVENYSRAEILARRMTRIAIWTVVFAAIGVGVFFLWRDRQQLRRQLANYEGTNAVLFSQVSNLKAEKEDLLLEIQRLEGSNKQLTEINEALCKKVMVPQ